MSSVFLRKIPPLTYTTQNILISLATVVTALSSLTLTTSVFLPLSFLRLCLPTSLFHRPQPTPRTVLIIGASSGIGFEVMKKYSMLPDTTIIAASSDIEKLRKAVASLGSTPATIEVQDLDLKKPPKTIDKTIREYDASFGPITHLYAVSGISNHLDPEMPFGLDVTEDMINVNISGTVAAVLASFERMKQRSFGKICIVGSIAGFYSPANMITYASTKAFINTFATDLHCLASPSGVDVVLVAPGFIRTRQTDMMRSQGSTLPPSEFQSAQGMANVMVDGVEKGGIGLISWPWRQSIPTYAFRGHNPLCDALGRWVALKAEWAGKKTT